MISEAGYNAVLQEVQRRGCNEGVLGTALVLYQMNYKDIKDSNPSMTAREVERSLLIPTSIDSVVTTAERTFGDQALRHTRRSRAIGRLREIGWIVLTGVFANFVFVILMIMFYLAAQDTAKSFFSSLGLSIHEGPTEGSAGEDPRKSVAAPRP